MAGVVASETVRAQTLQVFVCLQANTVDRPMLIRGCDITQDQAREFNFGWGIWFATTSYHLVDKVKNRRG